MITIVGNIAFCTLITIVTYAAGVKVFQRFKRPWLNPLYSATIFIICFINFFHLNMDRYTSGEGVFDVLLGTATVSLAVPLYNQLPLIRKNIMVIFLAVMPGTLTGVVSVILLTKVLHLNKELMVSLIPKSVTAPIALSISQSMGGVPSLTILFVVISAVFSLFTGPLLLKFVRIRSRIARGLALGTSAQAIGANRAFEWGELEGAMGSVAMVTSAVFLSILTPFLVNLLVI